MNDVRLDPAAVDDALNGPDGPVTRLMEELSERVVAVARAKVRVRRPGKERGTAYPPGRTLASIHAHVHWHNGLVYGGAEAVEDPSVFLEVPAEQMEREYPFLTTGLDSLEL